jgi:hypothetical protein
MPYIHVDIDDVFSEVDDDDLMAEVKARNINLSGVSKSLEQILETIWLKRREGKDYSKDLDDLIYAGTGKII